MVDPKGALGTLLQLTRDLLTSRPLQDALKLVTDAALAIVPGDHASIRVLDRSRTELLSGARSGVGLGKKPVRHVPGVGVSGWVVEHGEPALIGDTSLDERFVVRPNQGFDVRSMAAVPLWSAGEVIGVLAVTTAKPNAFSEDDVAMVSLLANCAVPPIEKARLARLAVTDAQTMAYNSSFLLPGIRQHMDRAKTSPGSLTLLLIDLDEFKQVNDHHGHAAGDAVLKEFAKRLRATTRERDLIVRRGGDEFVLIMPNTDEESARHVAERVRREMAERTIAVGAGASLAQTVSIGVATWDGVEPPEELEKRADAAMYAAKLAGRNQVVAAERRRRAPEPRASETTLEEEREAESK